MFDPYSGFPILLHGVIHFQTRRHMIIYLSYDIKLFYMASLVCELYKPIVNNIFLVINLTVFVYSWKHELAKLLKLEGASRLRCKIPEVFMMSPTWN